MNLMHRTKLLCFFCVRGLSVWVHCRCLRIVSSLLRSALVLVSSLPSLPIFAAGSARRVIAFSTSLMLAAKKLDSDRVRDTRASTADVLDDIALVFPELLPTNPIISELLRTCPQSYPAQSVPKYHIAFST
jgi:hypothetical protein